MPTYIETRLHTFTEIDEELGEKVKQRIDQTQAAFEKLAVIGATIADKWEGGVTIHTAKKDLQIKE